MPPSYDQSGPINYNNPQERDPFGSFDNTILYNKMIQEQQIAQYQQQSANASVLNQRDQRRVYSGSRFNYGVPGGQPGKRLYQRTRQLEKESFAAHTALNAIELAPMAFAGGSMLSAPVVLPMLAAYAATSSVNQELDRRKFVTNIASDIETNRSRIGLSDLSPAKATRLATSMQASMYGKDQFFDTDTQMRMHKIGIAEGLLDAKSGSGGQGNMAQYKKNFEELKKTTKDVVELLQTTVEGGMSVMKELKNQGFSSMKDIRAQIVQAKAYGGLTGMGSQNMMLVGAAGARAVQGTGIKGTVGSGMYQSSVTNVSTLSQSSPAMAEAVSMAGGAVAAGQGVARAQMNMLSSKMGSTLIASLMDPKTKSISQSKLNNFLSKGSSSFAMADAAANYGYAVGEGGRSTFNRDKRKAMNDLMKNPLTAYKATRELFKSWGSQYKGMGYSEEVLANQFAGEISDDPMQQEVMMQYISSRNPGFSRSHAAKRVAEMGLSAAQSPLQQGLVRKAYDKTVGGVSKVSQKFGKSFVDLSSGAYNSIANDFNAVTKGVSGAASYGFRKYFLQQDVSSGIRSSANWSDPSEILGQMYGLERKTSKEAMAMRIASSDDIDQIVNRNQIKVLGGEDAERLGVGARSISKMHANVMKSPRNMQYIDQKLKGVLLSKDPDAWKNIYKDQGSGRLLDILGIDKGSAAFSGLKDRNTALQMARTITQGFDEMNNAGSMKVAKAMFGYDKAYNAMSVIDKGSSLGRVNTAMANLQFNTFKDPSIEGIMSEIRKSDVSKGMSDVEIKRAAAGIKGVSEKSKYTKSDFDVVGANKAAVDAGENLRYTMFDETESRKKSIWSGSLFWKTKTIDGKKYSIKRSGGDLYDKAMGVVGGDMDALTSALISYKGAQGSKTKESMDQWISNNQKLFDVVGSGLNTLTSDEKIGHLRDYAKKRNDADVVNALQKDRGSARAYASLANQSATKAGEKFSEKEEGALADLISGFEGKFKSSNVSLDAIRRKLKGSGVDILGQSFSQASKTLNQAIAQGDMGSIVDAKKAEVDLINNQLKRINASDRTNIGGENYSTLIKEIGKQGEHSEIVQGLKDARDSLQTDIKNTVEREGPQGKSFDTTVAPPVLNYWNNRWSL